MVRKLGSCTRVVDVSVSTATNAISDVGTAPTRRTILEGMFVGDVCVLSVHMLRRRMLGRIMFRRIMFRRGFMLRRNGGCLIE